MLLSAVPAAIGEEPDEPLATPVPAAGSDWRESVRAFAKEHFRNPAWGYSHSARIHALALELAAADSVALDADVIYAAAFLHDIAAFPPWANAKVDHADEAELIVETLLAGTSFPMHKIEALRGAIRTHMFQRDPVGPEALYLHDADALDWLGSVGAARILALVDPNGGAPDGPAAVAMLEGNLASVPPRVLSPAGRARVEARRAELQQFLERLRQETDDLRNL
jgi:hypothetical protein